jgi:hypothetical protein
VVRAQWGRPRIVIVLSVTSGRRIIVFPRPAAIIASARDPYFWHKTRPLRDSIVPRRGSMGEVYRARDTRLGGTVSDQNSVFESFG